MTLCSDRVVQGARLDGSLMRGFHVTDPWGRSKRVCPGSDMTSTGSDMTSTGSDMTSTGNTVHIQLREECRWREINATQTRVSPGGRGGGGGKRPLVFDQGRDLPRKKGWAILPSLRNKLLLGLYKIYPDLLPAAYGIKIYPASWICKFQFQ